MSFIKDYIRYLHSEYLFYRFKRLYEKDPKLAVFALYDKIYGKHNNFNIENPKTLVEKIAWLELYTDTSLWTLCADKFRVREYVEKCGLSDFLPKNYGHWENPDDIDFSQLPNEFVLKSNNGCGTVEIVRDKSKISERRLKKEMKRWLKHPYGYIGAEKHYLTIAPCIIAEELLHQQDGGNRSLTDYKVWCFQGKPECILVIHDREGSGYLMDMYDTNWERIPNSLKQNAHYGVTDKPLEKPACLALLLDMASRLSHPFVQVRADFYIINDKPIIGELTFTSGYGNYTDEFYKYLGSKVDLSQAKVI